MHLRRRRLHMLRLLHRLVGLKPSPRWLLVLPLLRLPQPLPRFPAAKFPGRGPGPTPQEPGGWPALFVTAQP
jgi:hypothetical protein